MRRLFLLAMVLCSAVPSFGQTARQHRFGISISELTNVPQTLLPKLPPRVVTFCILVGGAAQETVIFRPVGGGTAYRTVVLAAGEVRAESLSASIPVGGLEAVTQNVSGDVTVECTYKFGN
jgi:hypothetical protein